MKHDDTTISSWLQSKYFYFSKDEISICCNCHVKYPIANAKGLLVKRSWEYLATQLVLRVSLSLRLCKEVHIVLTHFPTEESSIGSHRICASITGEIKIPSYYFRGINLFLEELILRELFSFLSFPSWGFSHLKRTKMWLLMETLALFYFKYLVLLISSCEFPFLSTCCIW